VLFLAKFDAAGGNLVWDSTYGENATIASGAAVGPDGHIYVSAHFGGDSSDPTHLESRLLKFDANGNLVWARAWGGIGEPGGSRLRSESRRSDGRRWRLHGGRDEQLFRQ
jgi:outer membrane protein assembly factor BamB